LEDSTEGSRRGFNASSEHRHIKYEIEKYEILLIFLDEINYQLKQSDKKILFNILNSISRHDYKIGYH